MTSLGTGGGQTQLEGTGGGVTTGGTPAAGGAGMGETASGGAASGGAASGGQSASGGAAMVELPETTVVGGITFQAMACGSALEGTTQVVLGSEVADLGGWSHIHNGKLAENGVDATGLLSSDLSVYDSSGGDRSAEEECGGDDTWRRPLVRRVEGHTNKHSNGLQVRGEHPDLSTVESLVIDLKLESEGTSIPTGIASIHDGTAVLQVSAGGDGLRIPIDPELYLDHWIRITIPAAQLGGGTPARLQFVAELSTGGVDDSRNDFSELDLNIHQIAYVMK